MSPAEAFNLNTPQISLLNRGTGSIEAGKLVFETAILSIMDFFGVEWRNDQISDLAELMHADYYWLQIAELKLFVLKAKKSEFNLKEWRIVGGDRVEYDGKIYGSLNPSLLMKWIARYSEEVLYDRGNARIEQKPKELPEALAEETDKKFISEERREEIISEFLAIHKVEGPSFEEREAAYRDEKIRLMKIDASPKSRPTALEIAEFAKRIARSEKMTKPEDIQFYENNAEEIEIALKLNHTQR